MMIMTINHPRIHSIAFVDTSALRSNGGDYMKIYTDIHIKT